MFPYVKNSLQLLRKVYAIEYLSSQYFRDGCPFACGATAEPRCALTQFSAVLIISSTCRAADQRRVPRQSQRPGRGVRHTGLFSVAEIRARRGWLVNLVAGDGKHFQQAGAHRKGEAHAAHDIVCAVLHMRAGQALSTCHRSAKQRIPRSVNLCLSVTMLCCRVIQ